MTALAALPLRFLLVVGLACTGVWLLVGMAWALITAAALLLLDLVTDPLTERGSHGRADRSA